MASKTAILSVRIVSDAKKAIAGFDNFASKLGKLESGANKLAGWGATATAAWGALAGASIAAASEMQQSTGAVEAVFKDQADAIKSFASDAADSVGLSAHQYQEMAALIGSQLKNLGMDYDKLVPKTDELIGVGADLAATYGGTAKEAVEALSSALKGEYDPMERYALSIKKSDINARLAAEGMDELEGEALRLAETEALLALVTEQSSDAMGMFAKEADTAAGQTERAKAKWEDTKALLGEQFLPVVTEITGKLGELAVTIGQHPELFMKVGAAVAIFTASMFGVIGMIKAYRAAAATFAVVRAIFSAVHNSILMLSIRVWLITAAQAIASAARTVTAWVVARAQIAGIWIALQMQALGSAIAAGAAWVASAARAAAGWMLQRAVMLGVFLSMQIQAAAAAIAAGASWAASAARAAAAWIAPRVVMIAATAATYAAAAAQWVLNAALSANPIGIVIALIVALGAALIVAYNKSETFRNGVQRAGDIAKAAFAPIKGFIDGIIGSISNLIGWIGRIKWPSPPSWVSNMFSAPAPDLTGVSPLGSIMRFMTPPTMNMSAAAPDLTAARVPAPSLAALAGGAGGSMSVDNSISVTVDGSGIVDARAVAEAIRQALSTDGRRRGLTTAAGSLGGNLWA